jgi:carbonic anhydrase
MINPILLCVSFAVAVAFPAGRNLEVKNVSPDIAIKKLQQGNQRFVAGKSVHPNSNPVRIRETAKGQHPFAVVLTCADSRLSPEIIFDQGVGDLFVVRVAGNTPSPEMIGSIEYAVAVLGARTIIVMGHDKCGAVEAAIKGGELPGSIPSVVKPIEPAVKATVGKSDRLRETILENVRIAINRLRSESTILSSMERNGELRMFGAKYHLESGKAPLFKVN